MKRSAADRRWSKAIREGAGYTCQRCGQRHDETSKGLHAAHIFSRGIKRTRLDPLNGLCLCWGCHIFVDHNPKEKEKLARTILREEYDALMLRAGKPVKAYEAG